VRESAIRGSLWRRTTLCDFILPSSFLPCETAALPR
jgi:hypothetical protein